MVRRPPRSTQSRSSAASDVYKRQVMETAITGVPDELRGHIVKATVVLAKGYQPSEELKKELQDHVKNVTAPYKYPRIIEFVNELPKTCLLYTSDAADDL